MPENAVDTELDWRDGNVPVSRRYGDLYYSAEDGLAETRYVFLDGNDLAERWPESEGFAIGELGFGTGLGFLAAWERWRGLAAPGAVLRHTSFEIAPLDPAQMARALARWRELSELSAELLSVWRGGGLLTLPGAELQVVVGDARETLPRWAGTADAWFLDGFAPSRNPELWEAPLLTAVFERTNPGGSCATYSAAGQVRRDLAAAGFRVFKRPGFGTKRDMTIGRRPAES
ncbi:MAG: tRNA (5-methylaminomethyl-2-thiouridine)(34)-methyltransferase MnmD [Pikeienuella sp.]